MTESNSAASEVAFRRAVDDEFERRVAELTAEGKTVFELDGVLDGYRVVEAFTGKLLVERFDEDDLPAFYETLDDNWVDVLALAEQVQEDVESTWDF